MFKLDEKYVKYFKKYKDKGVVPLAEEETEEEVVDTKKEEYKAELKTLSDKLNGKASSDVTLSEIEYKPLTEEEIKEKAKEGVEEKYALKKSALDTELQKSTENLTAKSDEITKDYEEKKKSLENAYTALENKMGNEAIKRGIARSSIIAEQIKSLGVEKIKDVLAIDDALASELKQNSNKIESLKNDYSVAVSNLDIEKALEINENIAKITKEQEEKIEEALKYNNTVKRQQAELDSSESKQLSRLEEAQIESQILKASINYFLSLPKEERLEAFDNDEEILQLLGSQAETIRNYIKVLP
ncbi:MAG: hypothetical protein J6V66_05360 [Clostridia bacterium]|nr:hypothetical protein [Clostridia bacterium]